MAKNPDKIIIETLKKENEALKRENKCLRRLTSSRRYHFAEKIASGYNLALPPYSRRRKVVEKIYNGVRKTSDKKKRAELRAISKKLLVAASQFEKIIVIDSIPWDISLKQRPHHLAREFAKLGYFVVYLEPDNPLNLFRIIDKGIVTINTYQLLKTFANDSRKKYFLMPNVMLTSLEEIQEVKSFGFEFIYDHLDEFHEDISGDLSTQIRVWNNLSSLKPCLCIATASSLREQLEEKLGKKYPIVMARNAVNVDHFDYRKNKPSVPSDMKSILAKKHPIVGFYGALAPWIDFDLLNLAAKEHPEWEFVYLGVDYNGAAIDLKLYDNVHNLGAKNYENLPAYASYFDCAIIPFRHGEIAKSTSPVKLFEYMAAGLPTVCTRDLKECEGYKYVYMAKNSEDFIKLLEKAIKDHSSKKVQEILYEQASKNTWSIVAKNISDAL